MLSAILSKVASFENPFSSLWIFWYTREASTAIIVSNLPQCWVLLRRLFHLKSFIAVTGQTSHRVILIDNAASGLKVDRNHEDGLEPEAGNMFRFGDKILSGPKSILSSFALSRKATSGLTSISTRSSTTRLEPMWEDGIQLEILQRKSFAVQVSEADGNSSPSKPQGSTNSHSKFKAYVQSIPKPPSGVGVPHESDSDIIEVPQYPSSSVPELIAPFSCGKSSEARGIRETSSSPGSRSPNIPLISMSHISSTESIASTRSCSSPPRRKSQFSEHLDEND